MNNGLTWIGKVNHMGQNPVFKGSIIILAFIMIISVLGIGGMNVQAPEGGKTIAGRVYTSQGENPGDGFNGTYAAVIVGHEGVNTTYTDSDGLRQDTSGAYWYTVTIPEGGWDVDYTYWILVDGTGWGDMKFVCTDHENQSVSSWKMTEGNAEQRDVNTILEYTGPKVITGRVSQFGGGNPGDGFEGAYAAVIVKHEGVNTTFVDPDGLMQDENNAYRFQVTIPGGSWETNDTYWIWVNGSGWGDKNATCTALGSSYVDSWKMISSDLEERNVYTRHSDEGNGNGENGDGPEEAIQPVLLFGIIGVVVLILVIAVILRRRGAGEPPE